ncbi:MAG: spermidine synthase [Flavobacteriales bacterium]
MTEIKKEIYRSYDEYGLIQVFDDGNQRQLVFDSGDQQSAMLKAEPSKLLFEYTRAMALVLIFKSKPSSMLLLGLGGGSLVRYMAQQYSDAHIVAVELRPAVIEVAHRYFDLPRMANLDVIEGEAESYLRANEPNTYSIIFSDIYNASGVNELQLQESYIAMCYECLADDGWLVLNCWREHRADRNLDSVLRERFPLIYSHTSQSGNWVIFAGKSKSNSYSLSKLRKLTKKLSEDSGFSFQSTLKRVVGLA